MARCKCLVCGAVLDTKMAHRVELIVNKKTGEKEIKYKYCCSKTEYLAEEERKKKLKDDRNRVYDLICDMFGYEIVNTKFFAEWTLWNKLKSDEIIHKYLRDNESYLQQICDKPFGTEYQKIMYFSAILKNSLKDYVPKVEIAEKPKIVVEETIYEAPAQSLNKRRSLSDLEDMF